VGQIEPKHRSTLCARPPSRPTSVESIRQKLENVQNRRNVRNLKKSISVPKIRTCSFSAGLWDLLDDYGGQYTHRGKVFELIDRRFAILRPLQESLVGRRYVNEENATEMRNLHRGGAECRGGGGDTSSMPEASHPSREDAPLADTADSARRRRRRALCFPI